MILASCLLAANSCTDPPNREGALDSLIAAERSFARAARDLGTRDAFVAYLADDGVLFRPRPVSAQAYLHTQPATSGILSWQPLYADVARSTDLGITTGPWNFRNDSSSDPIAHGQFFSIWRKQPNGAWKVVLDHGTSNPPPTDSPPDTVTTPDPPPYDGGWALLPDQADAARQRLLEIDRSFSATSAARGFFEAAIGYVSADVRVLRNGTQPLRGADELRRLATERGGTLTWTPLDGKVSAAGDLGYTYGEYRCLYSEKRDEVGLYVRAWRRVSDDSWRVVIDLMTPVERQ